MEIKSKATQLLALGWLIPGLGHVSLKKYWRGGVFFACITSMLILGLVMGGKIYSYQEEGLYLKLIFKHMAENPLTCLATLSDLGYGFIYILSKLFSFGLGNLNNTTFEFGTAYIAGAGLLNYLVALDAYDIALGKKK
jgi:hypothetical protein